VERIPKLACIQVAGCDPIVRSWKAGQEEATPINNPQTLIATLATGDPGPAYGMLRDLMLQYGGAMESVTDEEAFKALHTMAKLDGFSMEPAAAVAFAGLFKMVRQGVIDPDEVVVVNCTGHTFPVEKQILGDEWERSVDVTPAARSALPEEGLLAALSEVDRRVNRIAVIEDHPDAARLIERILCAHGDYKVLHAQDGNEGIELVQTERPDLIVLDLMMPGVDGFGVLDALKADESLRDVPVIVVTAKDLTPQERQRLNDQVETLLHKGSLIDEGALQDIIERLG
jgi:threonine synthase